MEGIVERLCKNCIYWDKETGWCRRNTPQKGWAYSWPSTNADDWCGEFKDKWQIRTERVDT